MRQIFIECEKQGVTKADMTSVLKELKLTDGMEELFQCIRDRKERIRVFVASDSNSWFIDVLLSHFEIKDLVDEVHTNPAEWNGDLLALKRYTTNEHCDRCPINMCKSEIVSHALTDETISSIIYVGDGSNDLCPVLSLKENDIACPREGYSLSNKLNTIRVMCLVVQWSNAARIVDCINDCLNAM
jgi:2,3-diketo-5-methylthio-1-phosphopentane phosphatase